MSQDTFQEDKLITRYLLGELSDDEQTQVEERAFSDQDYLERIRAVEKDLIDEYARGELAGTELQGFEDRFLASERRRSQIAFAKTLQQLPFENSATQTHDQTSSRWAELYFWRRPKQAFAFSVAAIALLVLISSVWIFREFSRSQREQAQNPPQPFASPDATPKPSDERATNNPSPSPAATPDRQTSQSVVASLLLLPGTSRSDDNHQKLLVSPVATSAQLRVAIENGDEYKSYSVALRTSSGQVVSTKTGLLARPARVGPIVIFSVPANLLRNGDYELSLNGINDKKQAEPLGYYYFTVRKE